MAELRRLMWAVVAGVAVGIVLSLSVAWELAVLGGWDAAALTFLASVWPVLLRADGARTQALATREDITRDTARLLLLAASGASLVAVGLALGLGTQTTSGERTALVTIATLTVVLSWTVVNTVFVLRYAHLHYGSADAGVDFGAVRGSQPDYRDFVYLAFTIGMTYQVSDTVLRDPRIRRTVLGHSFLSYVFGVVIVATGVNIIAGLAR